MKEVQKEMEHESDF